jgi:hypothetical protein
MRSGLESPSALAKILYSCPSLRSLSLEPEHFFETVMDPQGTWDNITSLAIIKDFARFGGSCMDMVFSSFHFPSLNEVVVKNDSFLGTWPSDAYISFITTSPCMITTFTLHGISISDLDLVLALRAMPLILHLDIENFDAHYAKNPITLHLMLSLRLQSMSSSLAPKLHTLRLISKCDVPFKDSAFISMVKSRWFKPGSALSASMLSMGKACIRSVVLKFTWRAVDAKVYKPLRNLDAEGLRVVVIGTNGVQV